MTPYDELPSLLSCVATLLTLTVAVDVELTVAVVPTLIPAAAAAAARTGSLETVLVMMSGAYPGAETVPPLTTDTAGAGVAEAVPVEEA